MENSLAIPPIDSAIESVLIGGDLSKLTPQQRVNYYKSVCGSLGVNPLTRPFDYITLNGKLTLYAKKDCTDQLRKKHDVSIDDVDIQEVGDSFVVKVKGHDKSRRTDVEIGVVRKNDMQGNIANAQMKAVTKAKRRLTLSLCGLGFLDETEIETIPDATPVDVTESGEIVDAEAKVAEEPKPVVRTEVVEPAKQNANRPYSPETLKERIKIMADTLAGKPCTDGQRTSVRLNLVSMTGNEENYHTLLKWLTGEAHSKELTSEQVLALLKWIHSTKDKDGQWIPDEMAIREAHAAYDAALIDQGQQSLI